MKELIGKRLGARYEILEQIGLGGMAYVYRGRDTVLNRFVAIKILRPEYNTDEDFVRKFRRESQSAAGLSHPNIVNVYDVGYEEDIHYIVMELVEGNTLKDYLDKMQGFMKQEAVINIGLQIASALSQAHQSGVVHRDIKAQNILINEEGRVKVADFGIARAVTGATIPNTKEMMGSVHYASPEQSKGNYIDARSDIYSLGILLYELSTKQLPFEGESAVEIGLKQIETPCPDPRRQNPDLSKGLAAVILRCTEKRPSDRYQSVEALAQDLKALRANGQFVPSGKPEPVAYTPPVHSTGGLEEEKVGMQRNTLNTTLVVLSALVLAIIFVGIGALIKARSDFDASLSEVPDVRDKVLEEAVRTLADAGFNTDTSEQRMSDLVPEGHVISQSEDAGERLKRGFTVKLVISTGPLRALVPTLTQGTLDEARIAIEKAGFSDGEVVYEFSDFAKGTVLKQSPKAGVKMPEGTSVDLWVSKGPKEQNVAVPNLEKLTIREAESNLNRIGLKLGQITPVFDDAIEKDHIVSNTRIGESVPPGTAIDVDVSQGPETTVPSTEAATTSPSEETTSPGAAHPVPGELKLSVTVDSTQFESESEIVKIEMVQGTSVTVVYEKMHSKSEGAEIPIDTTVKGMGTALIRVYYGGTVRLEQTIQF